MPANKLSTFLLGNLDESLITDDGITLARLKDDVAKARGSLKAIASQKIALFHSDAYIFLVWLLAAWQEGRKLLVPVDKGIASNPEFDEWFKLGEFDDPDISTWSDQAEEGNKRFIAIDQEFDALAVFTSGSTGSPVKISKKIWQLESEIAAMEFTFGEVISNDVVFNRSVSHQHFFGMPFGIFWALSRGSKISRVAIKGPHEWNSITPQVLITSPSFLKSVADTTAQHKNLGSNIQSIFCAGGVLDAATFSKINEVTNTRVVDIYGSSETGHIAWRSSPDMPWQVQAGVEFKKPIEIVLEIKSKFCPSYEWFPTSDLAIQKGDSFEILGRADQIIKIEGTRISLSHLVKSIRESELVDDCLISDLGNGRRSQLGGVLKLSKLGIETVEAKGKLYLINAIKDSLRGKVISISIPRRWRFVDEFPKNSLGKILKIELDDLFSRGLKAPIVISKNSHELSLRLLLDMPRSLRCFEGHFDEFPVVPGVALIEWAIKNAQNLLLKNCIFSGMSQIKFLNFIKPNQLIWLKLDFDQTSLNLKFQYFNADTIFSSGILKFRNTAA